MTEAHYMQQLMFLYEKIPYHAMIKTKFCQLKFEFLQLFHKAPM